MTVFIVRDEKGEERQETDDLNVSRETLEKGVKSLYPGWTVKVKKVSKLVALAAGAAAVVTALGVYIYKRFKKQRRNEDSEQS